MKWSHNKLSKSGLGTHFHLACEQKIIYQTTKMKQRHTTTHRPYIYGLHAVKAALANPQRQCQRLWVTETVHESIVPLVKNLKSLKVEKVERDNLNNLVGANTLHQGIVLQAAPLNPPHLQDLLTSLPDNVLILILDQITDPHNVGAIMRSAAAFGVQAVLQSDKQSPDPANSIIAKTASGAVEHVPLINVTNLSRTIKELRDHHFWCIGLDESGEQPLAKVELSGRLALIMGSEDKGMRRLTRENCDVLAKIPTNPKFPTLNVSNAAAIALYQMAHNLGGKS